MEVFAWRFCSDQRAVQHLLHRVTPSRERPRYPHLVAQHAVTARVRTAALSVPDANINSKGTPV